MADAAITQRQALADDPLAPGEAARFYPAAGFPGLDCLAARFRTHAYALHAHETYVIGDIAAGTEVWSTRGGLHRASAGDIVFNHPLDVHDGRPAEGGYAYRMTYPGVALLREVAGELTGRRVTATPSFPAPVAHDPAGAALFARAFAALGATGDALAAEQHLLAAYAHVLRHHARFAELRLGREAGPVARARAAIEAGFAGPLRLADLAAVAGLSRHHLIRAFRREVGLTPHAYLVDVRVRQARALLRAGQPPAQAALRAGFADQAHLTRAFKARLGVPPAAYARAVRG